MQDGLDGNGDLEAESYLNWNSTVVGLCSFPMASRTPWRKGEGDGSREWIA